MSALHIVYIYMHACNIYIYILYICTFRCIYNYIYIFILLLIIYIIIIIYIIYIEYTYTYTHTRKAGGSPSVNNVFSHSHVWPHCVRCVNSYCMTWGPQVSIPKIVPKTWRESTWTDMNRHDTSTLYIFQLSNFDFWVGWTRIIFQHFIVDTQTAWFTSALRMSSTWGILTNAGNPGDPMSVACCHVQPGIGLLDCFEFSWTLRIWADNNVCLPTNRWLKMNRPIDANWDRFDGS